MANNIAKIYAELIRKGVKTIKQVPKALKKEVEDLIKGDGNV